MFAWMYAVLYDPHSTSLQPVSREGNQAHPEGSLEDVTQAFGMKPSVNECSKKLILIVFHSQTLSKSFNRLPKQFSYSRACITYCHLEIALFEGIATSTEISKRHPPSLGFRHCSCSSVGSSPATTRENFV